MLLASQPAIDLFTAAGTALSAGNTVAFMEQFDPAMPGYERLRTDVAALVEQCGVTSSIAFLSEEETGSRRVLELDWLLELREKQEAAGLTRRREKVKCVIERHGKKWKIVELAPVSLLAPPKPR